MSDQNPEAKKLLQQVQSRIAARSLSLASAASEIGVTPQSLSNHLEGGYVRSDSLARYRLWCSGKKNLSRQSEFSFAAPRIYPEATPFVTPAPPRPCNVVDTFSGCGGLSLGFEVLGQGAFYDVTLAIDIEPTMIDCYNRNRTEPESSQMPARCVDMSDFINAAEIRAYYLHHVGRLRQDRALRNSLQQAPGGGLDRFLESITSCDRKFAEEIAELYNQDSIRDTLLKLGDKIRSQTSVLGFFAELNLPEPPARKVDLRPLVWADAEFTENTAASSAPPESILNRERKLLRKAWDNAIDNLRVKASPGNARGQLASSAGRIQQFLDCITSRSCARLRESWLNWKSIRNALRRSYFEDSAVISFFHQLYLESSHRVTVLLGGPPCQGFSRIGRGKIRSLKESGVQVHLDEERGDARNQLFESYVQFLAALRPDIFVFENVQHFSSEVKTEAGTFLATDLLSSAITELSASELHYSVSSRIISGDEHGVPQRRNRFFMVGLQGAETDSATILELPLTPPVALSESLAGLEALDGESAREMEELAPVTPLQNSTNAHYLEWRRITRPCWVQHLPEGFTDAHVCRVVRRDDRDWFRKMGPGTRWMDYRCDRSETLRELEELFTLLERRSSDLTPELRELLRKLSAKIDGSLSVRLLLETISPLPGELRHHLLTESYLGKRDGNHGDWTARLAPDEPSRTVVAHMGKDTYAFVHPTEPRMLSVREAARIQTFPDWFSFGKLSLVDAFRVIGNAVPPFLSYLLAQRVANYLHGRNAADQSAAA